MSETAEVKRLKNKITRAKKGLREKRHAFTTLNTAKTRLLKEGLISRAKLREFYELVESKKGLLADIKNNVKTLGNLNDQLDRAERSPLGWLWYILTYPLRLLWNLIKKLSKPLTMAGEEEGLELIATELLEAAVVL